VIDWLRKHVFIPLSDWRDGNRRRHYLPEVERELSSSREEIEARQFARFQAIVGLAYEQVPFYRRLYDSRGFHPSELRTPDDIGRVPIVTKDDFRTRNADFVNLRYDVSRLIRTGTGGTTDSPITLYHSGDCVSRKVACTAFFYRWMGCDVQTRRAFLWGATQDFLSHPSIRNRIRRFLTTPSLILVSSYLNEEVFADYYRRLHRFKPVALQSYATPLYLFCQYLERRGLSLDVPYVNTTAEPLYAYQRATIERVLGRKVFNWYGARELGHAANECAVHEGMHVNCYGLYLETVVGGRPALEVEGEIVATDLLNEAMPLIRYRIGDIGVLSTRTCSCGSGLPLLESVSGRTVDVFYRRDGTMIPGISFADRIITSCEGVEQLQIVQTGYEDFVLNIVKGPAFSDADVAELTQKIETYMRAPVRVVVNLITELPKERSGKVRWCKSEMALAPGRDAAHKHEAGA
jgi:phenylacetate-CoA ligase